jgi:rubrerythrin
MAENVTIEGLDESFHEILNENAPTDQNNNQQDEKSFICSICGKMLKTNSGHRRHEMGHSDSDQNKWECQICSKTFVDKGHFLGHVNKHIGIEIMASVTIMSTRWIQFKVFNFQH